MNISVDTVAQLKGGIKTAAKVLSIEYYFNFIKNSKIELFLAMCDFINQKTNLRFKYLIL